MKIDLNNFSRFDTPPTTTTTISVPYITWPYLKDIVLNYYCP